MTKRRDKCRDRLRDGRGARGLDGHGGAPAGEIAGGPTDSPVASPVAALAASPPALLRLLKFADWPLRDREAWIANTTARDPFDDPGPADHLRPDTLAIYQRGYCRWLTFLSGRDALDPAAAPTARVTPGLVWAYLLELQRRGNAPATIKGRLGALHSVLRIFEPSVDMAWIRRPGDRPLMALLPRRRRNLLVPDAIVLVQWAQDMMASAERDLDTRRNRVSFRNGLLLAMLAARARRLRAMTALRVGHELVFRDGGFEVDLTADLVKTNRPDWFPLPDYLTGAMRLYLEVARPALLAGQVSDRLWITADGRPMPQGAIQNTVTELTKRRFGTGFGPHRFRHAVATTVALQASNQPHLAADMLNITSAVAQQHYNRARQVQSSLAYEQLLALRKANLGID